MKRFVLPIVLISFVLGLALEAHAGKRRKKKSAAPEPPTTAEILSLIHI